MNITENNIAIANRLRTDLQTIIGTVSDGEGVAMTLLWSFFIDHVKYEGGDIEELARCQMEAFIEFARENITLVMTQ